MTPLGILRVLSWALFIGVASSLVYCQVHLAPWWYSRGWWHYSRGWPFPYGGAGEEFYPLRLCLDLAASLAILASTFAVVSSCVRHSFRYHLGTLFLIQTTVALTCALQLMAPGMLWPSWEPSPSRCGLLFGGGCAIFWVVWFGTRAGRTGVKVALSRVGSLRWRTRLARRESRETPPPANTGMGPADGTSHRRK